MTNERFIEYLEDPGRLSSISYEELKTMALAYPYANNLRILLAIKAKQMGHQEEEKQLQVAAAYSLSRKRLYQLMVPGQLVPQPVMIAQEEQVLELKPLKELEKDLEVMTPLEAEQEEKSHEIELIQIAAPEQPEPPKKPKKKKKQKEDKQKEGKPQIKVEKKEKAKPKMQDKSLNSTEETVSSNPLSEIFNLPALNPPIAQEAGDAVESEENEDPDKLSASQLATKSVQRNERVASETYANLLLKQGYKDAAIMMYEHLALQNPEKRAYFAAAIDKIKNSK